MRPKHELCPIVRTAEGGKVTCQILTATPGGLRPACAYEPAS